ncbi:MAG: transposase [Gemmatimonadetes bacterium]|nr:transposase [Gemmatimonadota bacterium]
MAQERRQFTKEYKIEAVRLVVEEKRPLAQVTRELGLGSNLLRRWKKELQSEGSEAFRGKGQLTGQDEEIRRLKRELEQARQENAFLKKAAAYFAKESR